MRCNSGSAAHKPVAPARRQGFALAGAPGYCVARSSGAEQMKKAGPRPLGRVPATIGPPTHWADFCVIVRRPASKIWAGQVFGCEDKSISSPASSLAGDVVAQK